MTRTRREFLRQSAIAGGVVVGSSLLGSRPVAASSNRLWLEAQSWWNGPVGGGEPASVPFPFRHVHFAVEIPYETAVSGIVSVPYRAATHSQIGTLKQVKWQDDKGGSDQTIVHRPNVVIGPDDVLTGTFQIDTRKELNSGWRLWRFYAVWEHDNGNQQVARPIYPVLVNNGKPLKNASSSQLKPTGWYKESGTDWGYVQAAITRSSYQPFVAKAGVWRPELKFSLNDKGGSPPVTGWSVHVDPDFHNGDSGWIVMTGSGPGTFRVPIDITRLAPGSHRLVARTIQTSGAKRHEGVGVYPFEVAA
jgi:hypothetical protein